MDIKIFFQYVLPHRALSRLVYWLTRWTFAPWKNYLINTLVRHYQVRLDEIAEADIRAYPNFNAFFTRKLKQGARQSDTDPCSILSPADGRISQAGTILDGRIFQAKGQTFSTTELLGEDASALPYQDGYFATIYLSPRDYHRVHMPLDGSLQKTIHIPGRLFSVAPFSVAGIPRLFARNERLVCHFQSAYGPFVVVLVGALLVSSLSTVWDGLVVPPYASSIRCQSFTERHLNLDRFTEMAHFNMGSTVIILLPKGMARLDELVPGQAVCVGQRLGQICTHPA